MQGDQIEVSYDHDGIDSLEWRLTKGGVTVQRSIGWLPAGEQIVVALDRDILPGLDYRVALQAHSIADSSDGYFQISAEICNNEPVPGILWPFAAGSWWEFYYSLGEVYGGETLDTVRTRVTREVRLEHEGEFVDAFAQSSREVTTIESVYGNEADGVYRYGGVAATDTFIMRNLQFPYPATIGTRSTIVRLNFDSRGTMRWEVSDTLDVELIAIDEEVETPAGLFNTHVYRYYNPPPFDVQHGEFVYSFMAPGIGQVAQIHRAEESGADKYVYVLGEYCLKNGVAQ